MRNRQESPTVAPTEIATKLPIGSSSSSANDRASSATEGKVSTHGIQTNKRLRVSSPQPKGSKRSRLVQAPRKGSYKKIGAIEAARLQKEGCDVAGMFLYRVSESRGSSDNGRTRTSWILTDVNDCDLIDPRFVVREVYILKHRGPGLTY